MLSKFISLFVLLVAIAFPPVAISNEESTKSDINLLSTSSARLEGNLYIVCSTLSSSDDQFFASTVYMIGNAYLFYYKDNKGVEQIVSLPVGDCTINQHLGE